MTSFRTDWAALGNAPAISGFSVTPAGAQSGADRPRQLDACGLIGGFAPDAIRAFGAALDIQVAAY